jgi:hypothetical protein
MIKMSVQQLRAPKEREDAPKRRALRQTTDTLCDRLDDFGIPEDDLLAHHRAKRRKRSTRT